MRILPFGSPRANGAEKAAGQQALASVQSYDEQRLDEETGADGWLTVAHVKKSYKKRMVVKGVSLAVGRGESVGLLGPNGAGKTTVFYMITGPRAGRRRPHHARRPRRHAAAHVSAGPARHRLSAAGSLDLPRPDGRAEHHGRAGAGRARSQEAQGAARPACSRNSASRGSRNSPSLALSGGERRRCEIARALASRPSFMLLDEPFAGIDPMAVGDIQQLVRHLTERGIGVLITDHNVRETLEPGRPGLHHLRRSSSDTR